MTARRLILLIAMVALLPAAQANPAWAPVSLEHTRSFEMSSRHTGQRYRIFIGLPSRPAPSAGYPVLYALDGGRFFPLLDAARDKPSANADHQVRFAARHGEAPDGLVVGIGYASGERVDIDARSLDYTPAHDCKPPCEGVGALGSGGAERFLDFIERELKPLIAREFPVDAQRQTLFGHSYGGLFTLYALMQRPGSFQRYYALSPSLWFGDALLMQRLPGFASTLAERPLPLKVRLVSGVLEEFARGGVPHRAAHRRMVAYPRTFAERLQAAGLAAHFEAWEGEDHGSIVYRAAPGLLGFAFTP
jgi:predicted alpha/beta superfamily hydrolase